MTNTPPRIVLPAPGPSAFTTPVLRGLAGAPGVQWRGAWDTSGDSDYLVNDLVSWQGSVYICTVDHTAGEPDLFPERWSLFASKGAAGSGGDGAFVGPVVPTGTLNGSNTNFTLAEDFLAGSTSVYRNGVLEQRDVGYTESSPLIIFTTAPLGDDVITVSYVVDGS